MQSKVVRHSVWFGSVVAGLVLFALTLRAVDPAAVADGIRRTGLGFLAILLIAGIRLAARAWAWSACAGPADSLPVRATFGGCVVGEALGNITPLGLVASEPAKVLWVRRHVSGIEASATLAVETLLYSVVVALMLIAGGVAAVLMVAVGPEARLLGIAASAGVAAVAFLAGWWMTREATWARTRTWLERITARRPSVRLVIQAIERMRELGRGLASQRPRTLIVVGALELTFQAAAVAEVYVTLLFLGVPGVTVLQAFLLEFANRAVTVAFKFVPFRLGVDELASGMMTGLLGAGASAGVVVAVIRKARVLFWSVAGMVLLGVRAWTDRRERWGRLPSECVPSAGTPTE